MNNANVCVATETLGRIDLLAGLVAISIDEVKYKKGQRYLTVVCDHFTGKVIWAANGRSKDTVHAFFDALGDERAAKLNFVTCDGANWIRDVVANRAKGAVICLDTLSWATDCPDEVRRGEWNELRRSGEAKAAKLLKGLRFLLLRNWENLTRAERGTIRDLEHADKWLLRAWQLKEELREVLKLPLLAAKHALDDSLSSRAGPASPPFGKRARTIRTYRASIEWKITNGIAESNNAAIGRIRTNARGVHDPEAFITMIMLDRAGIAPELPWRAAS